MLIGHYGLERSRTCLIAVFKKERDDMDADSFEVLSMMLSVGNTAGLNGSICVLFVSRPPTASSK